jgi:methylenetetrahydrofolate dehydrogenase (NADP+)/methenyltetrahydrofolate cyclohydrolase
MAKILYGKEVSNEISKNLRIKIKWLEDQKIQPTLAIVRIGENPDDMAYERGLLRQCEKNGITSNQVHLNQEITQDELIGLIEELNMNQTINGIMIFMPLPKSFDEGAIRNAISPDKDIDGINTQSRKFDPATPTAVMELMKFYGIPLMGSDALIINSSNVVGRPLAMMMLSEDSTITVGHAKTKDLKDKSQQSEIIVSAVGRAKIFNEDYFNEESIVIDVGINQDEEGFLCGDIDFEAVKEKVKAITPVPGGIGSVTTSVLLSHVVDACMHQHSFVQ